MADRMSVLRWAWSRYVKRHWPVLTVALVLMAIEGATLGGFSYMMRPMFDNVFLAGNTSGVGGITLIVAGIFLLRAFAAFSQRVIMETVVLRISVAMQQDMAGHLLALDSAYFQTNTPGTLIERVRVDTTLANKIWATILGAAGRDLISLVVLLGVAISIDPLWTLIAIAGVPLLAVPILLLLRLVRKFALTARKSAATLSSRLDEMFHGVSTIKLNTAERHEQARFRNSITGYRRLEQRALTARAAVPAAIDLVTAIGFAGVVFYGGTQIIEGNKTVGEFMSFFTAIGLIFNPLRRLANFSAGWITARASLKRIRDVFEVSPTILSPAVPAPPPNRPEAASIVFRDVTLNYGSERALTGLSFTAKAGQTTALVGASGAGKSSVFNTLTRIVDVDSGEISLGDTPLTQMDLSALRGLFSVVSQDAPMFDDSLRDNIVLAQANVSEDRLASALDAAHLTEFVESLPAGLDTPVGTRGSQLSGGQRQRVAIARALLRDAPILLLDEATSALDAESETHVQAALEQLSAKRTTIVIAHRLSTIQAADNIVVMDRGRAVDQGRHDELLARGGIYARLHALQFTSA